MRIAHQKPVYIAHAHCAMQAEPRTPEGSELTAAWLPGAEPPSFSRNENKWAGHAASAVVSRDVSRVEPSTARSLSLSQSRPASTLSLFSDNPAV